MASTPAFRLEGDVALAATLRGRATNLLYHVRNFGSSSDSSIHRITRAYPQGTIEVLLIEGREYVTIVGAKSSSKVRRNRPDITLRAFSGILEQRSNEEAPDADPNGRYYKPTLDTFVRVLGAKSDRFSPDEFRPAGDLLNQRSASGTVSISESGCNYSGLLAVMVDLVNGFRNLTLPDGATAKPRKGIFRAGVFVSSYTTSHGIVRFSGKPWLVEISKLRGVVAKPLEFAAVSITEEDGTVTQGGLQIVKSDATEECERLFGGIPSGAGFPTKAADFDAEIADGTIKVLISPEDFGMVFEDNADRFNFTYPGSPGWTFNISGTEAHNTNLQRTPPIQPGGPLFALHWKIIFSGSADSPAAVLSLESRDAFFSREQFSVFNVDTRLEGTGGVTPPGAPVETSPEGLNRDTGETSNVTLFVMFHGDDLIKCKFESKIELSDAPELPPEVYPRPFKSGSSSRTYFEGLDPGVLMEASALSGTAFMPNENDATSAIFTRTSPAVFWWDPFSRDAIAVLGSTTITGRTRNEIFTRGTSASAQGFEVIAPKQRFYREQPVWPLFFIESGDSTGLTSGTPGAGLAQFVPPDLDGSNVFAQRNQRVYIVYSAAGPKQHLQCSANPRLRPNAINNADLSAEGKAFFGIHVTGELFDVPGPVESVNYQTIGYI